MRQIWAVCGADDCYCVCGAPALEQEGLVSGDFDGGCLAGADAVQGCIGRDLRLRIRDS
jgi:hypothetical protein